MCGSGCGILYNGGSLSNATCPCGYGYWDVFRERFVTGTEVRAGTAEPRPEYEKRVKEEFEDEDEYEARMREQYIRHLNSCKVKAAEEEKLKRNGSPIDSSSATRSERELEEISRGDYKSRGLSHLKAATPINTDLEARDMSREGLEASSALFSLKVPLSAKDATEEPSSSAAQGSSSTLGNETEETQAEEKEAEDHR